MTALLAILLPILAQASADDLKKEIEKLRRENEELRKQLEDVNQQAVEDARKIKQLQTTLRILEDRIQALARTESGEKAKPAPPTVGPPGPVRGKVIYVDAKNNFIMVSVGKREKLQTGYKFEIMRDVYEGGNPDRKTIKVATAEFEKFMGTDESMSKLVVIEGKAADIKPDDEAVAIRALPPVNPPDQPKPREPGVYRITGRAGSRVNAAYTIDYGALHGAKQTALVYLYKDGLVKAKLRLDQVFKDYSVANIVDGSQPAGMPPPEMGEQVFIQELTKGKVAPVRLVDVKRMLVAVDLAKRDDVHAGQKLQVRREGKKVGTLVITDVQVWGSWAKPEGDTKFEDIQKGDIAEAVEEK